VRRTEQVAVSRKNCIGILITYNQSYRETSKRVQYRNCYTRLAYLADSYYLTEAGRLKALFISKRLVLIG